MFARICSNAVPADLTIEQSSSEAPPISGNCLIWSGQTIAACRRRLGCPPFQSSDKLGQQQRTTQHAHQRTAVTCRASTARRSKSMHSTYRRPIKRRSSPTEAEHPSARSAKQAIARNRYSSCTPQSHQQQQQPQQNPQAELSSGPHQQAHAPSSCIDVEQLAACIDMAVTHAQLEVVCNAFLHHPSFSPSHAALVVSRLHKVHRRPDDSQLLLLELLATKLSAALPNAQPSGQGSTCSGCSREQPLEQVLLPPGEVAAVLWGFAWAGYQPDAVLVEQLLHQFWSSPHRAVQGQQNAGDHQPQQQQHQQQEQRKAAELCTWPAALATLVAGLAGLGFRDSALWGELRAATRKVAPKLTVASLQQLAWGFATASQGDAPTTQALVVATMRCLQQCTADELAQFVMSFHSLQLSSEHELFQSAAQLMLQKVEAQQEARNSTTGSSSKPLISTHSTAHSAAAHCSSSQSVAEHKVQPQQQQQQAQQLQSLDTKQQQQQQQQRQRLPAISRPQPLVQQQQQQVPKWQQIGLQLPPHAGHNRPGQPEGRLPESACGQLLGKTTAICSAAVSHAYRTVLGSYDPLLSTLVLYRDFFQPA